MPAAPKPALADLQLDAQSEIERLVAALREQTFGRLRRKGLVLGISGGIDSAVCAALCARAVGPHCTLGLLMPERDSSPESLELGRRVAEHFAIPWRVEDVGPALEAVGCYRRYDAALAKVFSEYVPGCKSKIILPALLEGRAYRLFSAVIETPDGRQLRRRLPLETYQEVVAATNFKQRLRKTLEYHHADRLRYAVVGTPNRLEYDQGFFVKNGDGAADVKPIAHLYKTQVYQLAERLGVPEAVRTRPPTTDTYSLPQSQEEFFFALSFDRMDACLYGKDHGLPAGEVAAELGLTTEQVEWAYRDIDAKRKAAEYLHQPPLTVDDP